MKICRKCNKLKPLREFYNKARSWCIKCSRESCREYGINNKKKRNKRLQKWRQQNPKLAKLKDKRARLKKKYNITLKQLSKLIEFKKGKCWICGTNKKRLVIDHDHKTGRVRGMLCDLCNRHLGYFENMNFKKMQQYLDKPCHADVLLKLANRGE